MRDLQTLATRSLKALAVLAACITLPGCYSCSLNGGWEGQMNPFCVEKDSLIGPLSLSKGVTTRPPRKEAQTRSSPQPKPSEAATSRTSMS